jgi:2-polyprenyl-3-methyl-5-hydroxy-6-metoxy-1,4-benzoquinol methylase
MNTQTLQRIRQVYVEWKSWSPHVLQDHQYSVYEEEISRANLPKAARILEVGFGEGSFLDWARDHGFAVTGIELDPELVAAARARGHSAHLGEIRSTIGGAGAEFDAVVLFDVLEHIAIDGILELLDQLLLLLAPGGMVIARFPNGASPFGRAYQYGDATHLSVLRVPRSRRWPWPLGFSSSGSTMQPEEERPERVD